MEFNWHDSGLMFSDERDHTFAVTLSAYILGGMNNIHGTKEDVEK